MSGRARRAGVAALEAVIFPLGILDAYLFGAARFVEAFPLMAGVCAMVFVSVYHWPGADR